MTRFPACRRTVAGFLCVLGAGLASAGPAGAAAPDQTWNCRASAAYTAVAARDRDEPVVANGSSRTATESPDRARCADDDAKPVGATDGLGVNGPAASTAIAPAAVDQRVSARSSVADATPAGLALVVHAARAEASAACTAAGPSLSGSSSVPEVRLNGQALDTSKAKQTISELPTGEVVTIAFNEQTRSGGALTQRAVHVEFRNRLGEVVKEIVVAEARVAGGSQVCDRAAQEATGDGDGNGDGSGGGNGSSEPCIRGAQYDAANTCASSPASATATSPTAARPWRSSGARTKAPAAAASHRPARPRSPCARAPAWRARA
jgi:hypothetical protein